MYKNVFKTLKKSEKLEKSLWDKKYPFGTRGTILKPDHQDVLDAAHWLADEHHDDLKHNRLAEEIQNKMLRHGELKNIPLNETRHFRAHKEDFDQPEYSKSYSPFKDERAKKQAALKPIIVAHDGENYHVLDGQHRFNEAHKRGDPHIPVHMTHVDKISEDAHGALENIREYYYHQKEPRFKESEKDKTTGNNKGGVKINPDHGKSIADEYEKMKHDPSHPHVQEAYGALIEETKKQFHDIVGSGMKMSRIESGQDNPYKNSKELHHDIKNNKHIHFFPTEGGFGPEDKKSSNHPMLQGTGIMHQGKELLANDLFRIVHDINGHHHGGESGFGAKGEHQAYNTHKKMYSPLAQKALATETLGQNSWVNFGPHGEHNRTNPHQTKYAEQKAGLLPDHIVNGDWHSDNLPKIGKKAGKDT